MKIFCSVLACFIVLLTNAQISAPGSVDCGTEVTPAYTKWRQSFATNNLVASLKHDTCLNKSFSIVFYVIADTLGTWGITQSDIDTCVAHLNKAFAPICVSFMNCSTAVIPNHVYNDWTKPNTEVYIVPNWHTHNTINIYLPAVIQGSASGYAYYPTSIRNVIVIEKSHLHDITPIHEMGHFMGLTHTHDEIGGAAVPAPPAGVATYEFVNRSNCYQHGDGFCDTEADCYPLPNGTLDGNGEFYLRPIDNYMSYHGLTVCKFTQEQYNFMARVILKQRLYLH